MKYTIKTFPLLLPVGHELFFTTLEAKSIVIYKQTTTINRLKYFVIPFIIELEKKNNILIFKIAPALENSIVILNNFFLSFSRWLKSFEKPFKKILLLKGLGFRASISPDLQILELKLGYSHLLKIKIPLEDDLTVKIDKNNLIVEGLDSTKVGNFANHIRNLRYPDSYKGKGFWYKNEIKSLKEVKKT